MTSDGCFRQPWERCTRGGAGHCEGVSAGPVRDACVPVETAAAPAKRRDKLTQLGVHRAAVVALVVVLQDYLPVRGDLVDEPVSGPQVCQRVRSEPVICPV